MEKSNCSGCEGCQGKEKPKDCKGNSCGTCCGNNREYEEKFLIDLLEKYFLPFVHSQENGVCSYIYKDSKMTTEEEVLIYQKIIKKYETLGFLTLDYNIALDEYSYKDYEFEFNQIFKRGSIAITKECISYYS